MLFIDIDATRTAKLIGINRNTINRFYIIFRRAICYDRITHITKMLNCTVELDETYFGAKRKRGFGGKLKRGRGTQNKPVFGIFKRNRFLYRTNP
jgi:transposase